MVATLLAMGFIGVLVVLSMTGDVDDYTPMTDDGATIFHEACARCHGEAGAGGGPSGPKLHGRAEDPEEVRRRLREGEGRMPSFPNIQGMPLENLMAYVHGL